MLGQSFAPLMDPAQRQQPVSPTGLSGAQEPIKILNLRMPRVAGAGAPAPQALLNSPGSAALPQAAGANPVIAAILRAVLGQFAPSQMAAPSAPSGFMGGIAGRTEPIPGVPGGYTVPEPGQSGGYIPAIHYQQPPLPGGTAGPNPSMPQGNPNRPQPGHDFPMPYGRMNR